MEQTFENLMRSIVREEVQEALSGFKPAEQQEKSGKTVLTSKEACQMAQVSAPMLRQWINTPGFPVLRAGTKILIPVEEFRRWLTEQAVKWD